MFVPSFSDRNSEQNNTGYIKSDSFIIPKQLMPGYPKQLYSDTFVITRGSIIGRHVNLNYA